MVKRASSSRRQRAFSLMEVLAVSVVLGVVALIVISRFSDTGYQAKRSACHVHRGHIEIQVQRWFRNVGTWPATNLSDIGADPGYFPEGLPTCPVDSSSYVIDASTHKVVGHDH